VRITASSSAPMYAVAARYQEVGNYRDDVVRKSATSLGAVLHSNERDSLTDGVRSATPASFASTWRVTDPTTGAVVSQDSGTQAGTTLAKLEQVVDVRSIALVRHVPSSRTLLARSW
jgi:hypothetical protein